MKHTVHQVVKTDNQRKFSWMKIIITVLIALLILSSSCLAARCIYLNSFAQAQATATVSNNQIGEENGKQMRSIESNGSSAATEPQTTVLELYQNHPTDNQKFEAKDLLPGDHLIQYFCVKTYHDTNISLFFRTEITDETKSLADVLHLKVTNTSTGKVLCDAPFAEVGQQEFSELLQKNTEGQTISYYQVDVSLDTSVGNEYQAALLKADFEWYVEDDGGLIPPPQTGDTTNTILWIIAMLSVLLLVLLLIIRSRKEKKQYGQTK